MTDRLDQRCKLALGTRDAFHVPAIVGQLDYDYESFDYEPLLPGSYVKFIDDKFTKFNLCDRKDAHGYLNPNLEDISWSDNVLVFLFPGITTPVRHQFEIDLSKKDREIEVLEEELKLKQERDPECAECWFIYNNEVIRG